MSTSSEFPAQRAGFHRLPAVLARFPVSRATWWAGVRAGKYPQSVRLSAGVVAWRVEDIDQLVARVSQGEQL